MKKSKKIFKMKIIELKLGDQRWKSFLEKNQHLIFHTPKYKQLIDSTFRCKTYYLAAIENNEIKTIFPFFHVKHLLSGEKVISIAYNAYGGPCGDEKFVPNILSYARKKFSSSKYIEIRQGLEKFDRILAKLTKLNPQYKRFVLKLTTEQELLANMDKQKRKAIRKSERYGIIVREIKEDEIDDLYNLYLKNMKIFGSPPLPKKFFINFYKYLVNNNLGKCFGSYYSNKLISMLLGFCYKDRIHITTAVSHPKFLQYRPNEAVHWYLMKYGLENNYKFFDFDKVRLESGQFRFKKEWGAKLFDLNHYYLLMKTDTIPLVDPTNKEYKTIIRIWKRMPLFITRIIGPWLRESLGI